MVTIIVLKQIRMMKKNRHFILLTPEFYNYSSCSIVLLFYWRERETRSHANQEYAGGNDLSNVY